MEDELLELILKLETQYDNVMAKISEVKPGVALTDQFVSELVGKADGLELLIDKIAKLASPTTRKH